MPSDFVPKRRLISAITRAQKAVVTTSEDHGFETGFSVRLWVPEAFGMNLFFISTLITVTSSTEFETEINTVSQLPFAEPIFPPAFTDAQAIPITGVTNNRAG